MECSIVLIIDQSKSMGYFEYIEPVKDIAAAFANVMDYGDNLGVVAFDQNASVIFGSKTSLTPLDSITTSTAMAAIAALTAKGTTNMEKALNAAAAMMAGGSGAMGQVLLSDGGYNEGGDPVSGLAATPPIHTVAMGAHGQQRVMKEIASKTGGKYHFAPKAEELAEIYFAIANQASVASLVISGRSTVEQSGTTSVSGTIPSGATQATFGVWWESTEVVYTPNTPLGSQVQVYLTDPNGTTVSAPAVATGSGFVVLKIVSPSAGTYTVHASYSGTGSLKYTAGIFDDNGDIGLLVALPRGRVPSGSPLDVEVHLADRGEPIDGATLSASVESPLVTLDEVLAEHAARLEAIAVPGDVPAKHAAAAKLAVLQRELGTDLFPRRERPASVSAAGGGLYRIRTPALERCGSHTLRVTAHGFSRTSGTVFQRSSRGSFIVA